MAKPISKRLPHTERSRCSEDRAIFFDLHSDLPHEGPDNRASAARALAMAGPLPANPRALDIDCGPGMQTM